MKEKRKLSIVNSQLSIVSASFWWALSGGTKWSGRSVAVWAQRVCGAHSETQWRSSSADAALNFWFFSFKRKERIRTWSFGSFASSQKNRYEHQIQYQNQLFLYLHFQLFLFNLPYFSIGKENCCLGGTLSFLRWNKVKITNRSVHVIYHRWQIFSTGSHVISLWE